MITLTCLNIHHNIVVDHFVDFVERRLFRNKNKSYENPFASSQSHNLTNFFKCQCAPNSYFVKRIDNTIFSKTLETTIHKTNANESAFEGTNCIRCVNYTDQILTIWMLL